MRGHRVIPRSGQCDCRGRIPWLAEKLVPKLPGEGSYDTLSGFVLEFAHETPAPGTTIEVEGIKFTVQRATPQVVQEVQIRW